MNSRSPGREEMEDDDIHVEISEAARKLAELEKKDRQQQTDNTQLTVHTVDIVGWLYLLLNSAHCRYCRMALLTTQ